MGIRVVCGLAWAGLVWAATGWAAPLPRYVTVTGCIQRALLGNRALQIERINPQIARSVFEGAYAPYDPLLFAEGRWENATDSGGLDPADFSRDAIYQASSEVARVGLMGLLPSGMSYQLNGGYARSEGTRNFLGFESYNLLAGLAIRQPLLRDGWIDQARMVLKVNKEALRITELGVEYLAADVVNQVQQAYYELLFARADEEVQRRLRESRAALRAGVGRQVRGGMLTLSDEELAASQLAAAEAAWIRARQEVALAENVLRTLMGEVFTNEVGRPLVPVETLRAIPEEVDLAASWRRGLESRADLGQLRHDLQRADIDLKYRRNQMFPSLDVVAGYGRRGASTEQVIPPAQPNASSVPAFRQLGLGENPSDFVGMVFSVPLGRVGERKQYQASRWVRMQADLMVRQREELVLREIQDAAQRVEFSWERVGAAARAAEAAEAVVRAEGVRLEAGESTVLAVLQLQRDAAMAASAWARAKADFNQAVSALRFADASLLGRLGIEVALD